MMNSVAHKSLVAIAALAIASLILLVFFHAPVEASMGVVQKIFYIHVPSAYAMYLGWAVCCVSSIAYLARRKERWDMLAQSAAEVAFLFAGIVMITGPLWGRKSWGVYWTWDPRLTSALLLTLIIASYVLLRSLSAGEAERRFAAALSILGACLVPIIHLSVQRWRGQHPTVITGRGGGLAPEMRTVFFVGLAAFTILFAVLLARRYALEKTRRKLGELWETAAELGIERGESR